MKALGFSFLSLLLFFFLSNQGPVSAAPLDAVEKRVLEERQELMRSGSSQNYRQTHFEGKNNEIKRGKKKKVFEVYPEKKASDLPAVTALKAVPEPAAMILPVAQEENRVDIQKPPDLSVVTPPPSESRVVFDAGAVDTTDTKYVRSTSFNVGVGYKMTEQAILGLEAQREINDPYEASAGRASEEDQSMNVRYKFQF